MGLSRSIEKRVHPAEDANGMDVHIVMSFFNVIVNWTQPRPIVFLVEVAS